jgi:aldose 1-epimerase
MDASFGYVVLYSGDPLPETHRRRSLAIEPMTCGTDAFNHPEWGLVTLSPGAIFKGAWGVTPEFGDGA